MLLVVTYTLKFYNKKKMIARNSIRKRLMKVFENVLLYFGHCTYENTQTHIHTDFQAHVCLFKHMLLYILLRIF